MARSHMVGVRLTEQEWNILQRWIQAQDTDPDAPLTESDAIRQAIHELERAEQKRKGERLRRRGPA